MDFNLEINDSNYPEVLKAAVKEVKALGDNVKGFVTDINKNYEQLKQEMEKGKDDYLSQEKINKFTEEISSKQAMLDEKMAGGQKEINSRIDSLEVAMKRNAFGEEKEDKLIKEAYDFQKHLLAVTSEGAKFSKMKNFQPDSKFYKQYREAFGEYLVLGGQKEMIMSPENVKALMAGSDPDGGVTVPTAMSNRIIQKIYETDPVRQLCAVESITTGAIEWLVDIGESGAEWESETVSTSNETTPQFSKKRIAVNPIATRPRITQTLIEDSGINIENWLANKVGDKIGRTEAASFVTGDGVGKPRGFLTYGTGTTWGTVEQVNMGAATTLTADGFVDVKYALTENYLNRGTWLMNRTTVSAAMKLKTGSGDYIWKPAMLAADPSSTILGLPVRMSTTMPAVAASALSVVLADWMEAYMIVDRLGVTVQRDPYTAKPFIEFYFRKRVGGDVINFEAIKIGKISA